jgi:hypothetical protein
VAASAPTISPLTPRAVARLALAWSGGLLVLAAGAIHLWLWFDYFHRVHVVGALFLVNFAASLAIGFALLVRGTALVALAGIAFAAGTLGGFFLSVWVGLFSYTESLRGPWQEAAGGVEVTALVVLVALLPLAAGLRRR